MRDIQGDTAVGGRGKKVRDGILGLEHRRAVTAEQRSACMARGFSDPETHPLYEETGAELLLAMIDALTLAANAEKPWRPYWNTLKKRARQHVWGDDYTAFPVTEWYKREMTAAKAKAIKWFVGLEHSEAEMLEVAKAIFIEGVTVPKHRLNRAEAWAMVHTPQISLFFEVTEPGQKRPVEFVELVADSTAADPAAVVDPNQLDLITHLVEVADLNSRQRAIALVLSEESPRPTNVALARTFGVSKVQIGRDIKRIRTETSIQVGPTKT